MISINVIFVICSYDLVGGSFLVWSDQAKLAPPPLYATLRLQHVTPEGWEVLQEIKALGGWSQPNEKKSRRKQSHVQRIEIKEEAEDPDEEVEVDFDLYGLDLEEEPYDDPEDEDYDPGKEFDPEEEYEMTTKPKRPKRKKVGFARKYSESSYTVDSETASVPYKVWYKNTSKLSST